MKLYLVSTALFALCTFSSALDVDGSLVQESSNLGKTLEVISPGESCKDIDHAKVLGKWTLTSVE